MTLLVVGDLHGETETLFRLLDARQPDGLLSVGDWGDAGQIAPETWQEILHRVPILTVYGNHDDLPFLAELQNRDGSPVLLAQGERRRFCGLSVAGVSGIWAKSHRLTHYVTDEDVAGWAASLAESVTREGPIDILLTHGCPVGVADQTPSGRPGGQPCFLELLRRVRPCVYLCGHLHVPQERDLTEPPSHVLNVGALPQGTHPYVSLENTGASSGRLTASLQRFAEKPLAD